MIDENLEEVKPEEMVAAEVDTEEEMPEGPEEERTSEVGDPEVVDGPDVTEGPGAETPEKVF